MRRSALILLLALLALALLPAGTALAHNQPTIRVEPSIVAVGGKLTVIGIDMSADLEFAITLERVGKSILLGSATATAPTGGEGGFTEAFVVPVNTPPGSYTVRAQTQSGKISATADLTVTKAMPSASMTPMASATPVASEMPAAMASAMPAPVAAMPGAMEASAEEHDVPRQRSGVELFATIAAAVVLAGAGMVLGFRGRE